MKAIGHEQVGIERINISKNTNRTEKAQYRFRVGESKNGGRNISTSTTKQNVTRYQRAGILKLNESE